ncbi:MAG: deoxyribose-phosphate aldolase [Chloroflexi bacterium RBG_13_56_8]|nr:MAG: deoxyribose-phosphate aldolase [Chloroflexi bacterium RBG_13_56_8]
MLSVEELAQMIDHSILLPATTDDVLVDGIEMAKKYHVGCVVPKAYQIPKARELLRGTDIRLCCPIGFPQGLNAPEVKRYEAQWALQNGAVELDMVINITALKSGDLDLVARDIAGVVQVASQRHVPVKVILETCLLTDEEKVIACQIAEREGAAFVKTSTQTQPGGATVEDIRLMRATVGPNVIVKASGYITDIDKTLALYEAGARRFGTGYTLQILTGLERKLTATKQASLSV